MTYLGIDYGQKRIGLAISDPNHRFSIPFKMILMSKTVIAEISEIIQNKAIQRVVVGIPKSLKGIDTASTEAAQTFVDLLRTRCTIPVDTYSEVMTTQMALKQQRTAGISQKSGRNTIDALAARNILDAYLQRESHHDEPT